MYSYSTQIVYIYTQYTNYIWLCAWVQYVWAEFLSQLNAMNFLQKIKKILQNILPLSLVDINFKIDI